MLTPTVTISGVETHQQGISIITFQLVIADSSGGLGFTKTYSIEYRTGDTPTGKVQEMIAKMNPDIANYKISEGIRTAAALITAVANISGGLTL